MEVTKNGHILGQISIELRPDIVPKTVENFRGLCTNQFGFGYENRDMIILRKPQLFTNITQT